MNIELNSNYNLTDDCFIKNFNEILLDYINNFLSINKLVEYYNLTPKQVQCIINKELDCEYLFSITSLKQYTETLNFMRTTLLYYTDAGHGWLAVPINVLKEISIYDKITYFSFKKDNIVFLEEDGDMTLFLNTIKKLFNRKLNIKNIHTDNDSIIRTYERVKK